MLYVTRGAVQTAIDARLDVVEGDDLKEYPLTNLSTP